MSSKVTEETILQLQRVGLKLKINALCPFDKLENIFAINLWEKLNTICLIESLINKYSTVDFKLTSKKNPEKIIYIELKSRDPKWENCNEYLIGESKLKNITKESLTPTLLVWTFGTNIYFTEFNEKLIDYPKKVSCDTKAVLIPKSIMTKSFDKLIEHLTLFFE